MGKEKARLYGEQEDNIEENIRTKRNSWGQQGTPMQQMLIEEEEEIGYALYVENGAIQPKIVDKEREKRRGQQKCHKSWQKKVEDSKLPTDLQ